MNRSIDNRTTDRCVGDSKGQVLVKHAVALALGAAVAAVPVGSAYAAGFALIEHSAAGVGNAFSGGAAQAGDLSTVWFNPAGMTRFDGMQVQLAAHGVTPEFDYTDEGTTQLVPGVGAIPAPGFGDDGGIAALLPANYMTYQITDRLRAGLAITVPFGLKTKYDAQWVGRFQAVKSEIFTTNFNPSISFDVIPDTLSLGVGVSAMYMNAELSNALNNAAILGVPGAPEGFVRFKGNDWGFGFNAGLLYQLNPDTRFGIHYRSEVEQELEGNVRALGPTAAVFNDGISVNVDLPQSVSLSGFHKFHERWAVMADATWTDWSSIPNLTIGLNNPSPAIGRPATLVEDLQWEDAWRLSIGLEHYYNPKWTWRAGVAWDQSPAQGSPTTTTARLPDNDRLWVALGVGYKWSDTVQLDAGYAHLFIDETEIRRTNNTGTVLTGNYNSSADVLGIQARIRFK